MLDDLYEQIPLATDEQKIEAVRCELATLSGDYEKRLYFGGTINYNSPVIRFAYTYCYVASHADVMYQIIRDNQTVRNVLHNSETKIACLGGGPGSDLLGILKFMRLENISAQLKCTIYDREEIWQTCIESITEQIKVFNKRLKREPRIIGTVICKEMDIVNMIDKFAQEEIADINMLTISFLVSELNQNEAKKIFLEIFDKISSGCIIVLIDNCSGNAHMRFDTMVNEYNNLRFANSIMTIKSEQKTFTVDWREDKKDLEPYWSKLNWHPRLKLPVHYRIYLKA